MKLSELAERIPGSRLIGSGNVEISRAVNDSRCVRQGDLFVALPGTKIDGHQFIQGALDAGARAAIVERPVNLPAQPSLLVVRDAHAAYGLAAHALAGNPTQRLTVCGVTGTSGKTTTTYLIRSIFEQAGWPTGLIGTIAYEIGRREISSSMTTPAAGDLAAYFAEMVESGLKAAVMEVSSHALHQRRTAGIRFRVAAFTNLTSEHRDYHKTMAEYRDAKGLLFESLDGQGRAVLNADDKTSARYAAKLPAGQVLWYGVTHPADVMAKRLKKSLAGTTFTLVTPRGRVDVRSPLLGLYNVRNSLAAAAVAEALAIPLETIAAGLEAMKTVRGRLEAVPNDRGLMVLVDYAHKTDALRKALGTVRRLVGGGGRLIVVFGCGGDRDRKKRPAMARVAQRLADRVFLTSDNPRSESPQAIADQIGKGFTSREKVTVELDRRAAIGLAIREARPGDVVIIAGKGHETYQIIGDVARPFDDRAVAQEIFSTL